MRSILFIVGAQRSCTTLLARMLSLHPKILLTIEGKLLYYLITWIGRDKFRTPSDHLRLDEIAYSLTRLPIKGIPDADERRMRVTLLTRFRPSSFRNANRRDIIRTIWCETYDEVRCGKPIIGDKYNEYLLQLPEIIDLFPEARFVFIHRNPLDVAESMVRAFQDRPWRPETHEDALRKWAQWNAEWLCRREVIPAAQRSEIAAASLLRNPKETLTTIGEFLNIDCDGEYLSKMARLVQLRCVGRGGTIRVDWQGVMRQTPEFWEIAETLGYTRRIHG